MSCGSVVLAVTGSHTRKQHLPKRQGSVLEKQDVPKVYDFSKTAVEGMGPSDYKDLILLGFCVGRHFNTDFGGCKSSPIH